MQKFIFQPNSDKSGKFIYTTVAELIDKPSAGLKIILNMSYTDQFGCFNKTLLSECEEENDSFHSNNL